MAEYSHELHIQMIADGYSNKAESWGYEREYRLFVPLAKCEPTEGHYFLDIRELRLRQVILGQRCELDELYFARFLEKADSPGVPVERARLHSDEYKMEIRSLPDQLAP